MIVVIGFVLKQLTKTYKYYKKKLSPHKMNFQPPRKKYKQQSLDSYVDFQRTTRNTSTQMSATSSKASPVLQAVRNAQKAKSSRVTMRHLGIERSKLRVSPEHGVTFPDLKASNQHKILVKFPLSTDGLPTPHPLTYKDNWDDDHVKMPCSSSSVYPIENEAGEMELKNRWNLIKEALSAPIIQSIDLQEAILKYNTRYAQKWDFACLHTFFNEELEEMESTAFFAETFPKMVELALQLPSLCTQGVPLLKQDRNLMLTMSQQQIASLLANAFFCTFPRRNTKQKQSEYVTYPEINFNQLFCGSKNRKQSRKFEKLKCLIHYFKRVTKSMPRGLVTFHRQVIEDFPKWNESDCKLTDLHITADGTIEDNGYGMLQVDFANKYVGGGVLNFGCVQEEIRFLICPEMIISKLFTEVLESNECLIMTGCERFSSYSGYADTFEWTGNYVDADARDRWHRLFTEVVAIDAVHFTNKSEQFTYPYVKRELDKAYTGFHCPHPNTSNLPCIATGNWGCGAFRGDLQLKCLVQMMAAAQSGRQLCYFTFGDEDLCCEINTMHQYICDKQLAISDILSLISQYNRNTRRLAKGQHQDLFTYIYNVYDVVGDDYHSSSDECEKVSKRADEMSDSDAPSNPLSNPPSNAPSDTPTLEMSPDDG